MNTVGLTYRNLSFTLYNMIDDDSFVMEVERDDNERYDIDDFEWTYVNIDGDEKALMKSSSEDVMRVMEMLSEKIMKVDNRFKLYPRHDTGNIILIKLKKASLPEVECRLSDL